ncbi:carbohydrate kinase [Chromobacterium violaceum]|uniref:carbohydrate kinase family protein n=1 Tax=Chromobacterium violaceum TaxID=536 RepID=UPI001BECFCA6|nr:carbohydrate kinase [Chromobacterium violaceum]MBT2867418.1 carbohydrate kinase [Chromobacterium violaceum]
MSLPHYLVFGEALTDFILQDDGRWQDYPGGSCWNVARVAAQLGCSAAFAGAVSQDRFGDALWQGAEMAGLDMRYTQQLPYPPLLAMVPSSRPPQYFFIGDNSADLHFDPAHLPAGWDQSVRIAHFGCISLAREPLASRLVQLARQLTAQGCRIAFDPNFRNTMRTPCYQAHFNAMLSLADYIKVADDDLFGLYPGLGKPAALATLRRQAPQASILFTQGADGMTLFADGKEYRQAALPVAVADTVGCGDTAMGSWMTYVLHHPQTTAPDLLRFVATAAACTARQHGAYAPTLGEVTKMLT